MTLVTGGRNLERRKVDAIRVLAGGIAHEIRNPLAISSSAAQFLLEDPPDPEFRRECLDKILGGIRRASSIIETLLRFARPGVRGDMPPADLAASVQDALRLVTTGARTQHVTIVLEAPDHPVRVSGAPSLLQQVFMNLVLNALAAMPEGGLLRVSIEQTDTEALVRIRDTGHGIPSGELGKVFDPFYTTRPVGQGTGLGLFICHAIVEQHFGTIAVESIEGHGSTFTVRLPLP